MIDNDTIIRQVKIALKEFKDNEAHAYRCITALSNRLHEDVDFTGLVLASYQAMLGAGLTATSVALTLCMGMFLAQGAAPWSADSHKADEIPEIPPSTLLQ